MNLLRLLASKMTRKNYTVIQVQVWEYLRSKIDHEKVHLTLIDPSNQPPSVAGEMAHLAGEAGTDGIMVGGSTGLSRESSDATVKAIKDSTSLPVIIFPTNSNTITKSYFASIRRP